MSELFRKLFAVKIGRLDNPAPFNPVEHYLQSREHKVRRDLGEAHVVLMGVLKKYYDYQIEHFGNYAMAIAYAYLGDLPEELLEALHDFYLAAESVQEYTGVDNSTYRSLDERKRKCSH